MSRGVNKAAIVEDYRRGDSIPIVAAKHGIPRSTVRLAVLEAGALRSRAEGVRLAAQQGRVGNGLRGKSRTFSAEHREAIRASAVVRGERVARGIRKTQRGYVEVTRGENKGRLMHRVIAEQMMGRPLDRDEVVHHIDRNRDNNDTSNLQVMTRSQHTALHRKEGW